MKKTFFPFFMLFIPLVIFSAAENNNGDIEQLMQLAERRAQQVAALSKTGIFELDQANAMHRAAPFLLGDNCLRLVFEEPILVSIIKAVYESMSCVERVEGLGKMRQAVKEVTLKLNSDAYQKAVYCAKLLQSKQADGLVNSARSYSALENNMVQKKQQQQNRLLRCLNWFVR